ADVGRQRLPRRGLAADGFIEKQFGKAARRQPGEGAALGKTSKRQAAIAFDAMPADLCGLKPFTGHRFDRVTKYGTQVTEFNSHGALIESFVPSWTLHHSLFNASIVNSKPNIAIPTDFRIPRPLHRFDALKSETRGPLRGEVN